MSRPSRRGPWLPEEDGKLLHLVSTLGPNNWVRISHHMQHRTPKQCRERYHQNLKPSLTHDPITAEEGERIEQLVKVIGKKWAEIARYLGNRSDNAVKNWWNGSINRRKRIPTHANGISREAGYRSQPISASVPRRPLYNHEASPFPRDTPPLDISLPPPFARQESTATFPGYSHPRPLPPLEDICSFQPAVDEPRQPLISPTSVAGEHSGFRRRHLSPVHLEDHPRPPSLPPIRGFRLPPISHSDLPAPSPTTTDDSTTFPWIPPSLISDNLSNYSISPKTVPSPRPVLDGSKDTTTDATDAPETGKELPRPCEVRGRLADSPPWPVHMSDGRGQPHENHDQTGRARAKDHRITVSSLLADEATASRNRH
ncbi:hypothetical protein B0A52_09979 [Exophiala mesophila]|uniref:Myb-like DNA-binding protein myb-1 n=1 Tax=Exophiala mesophila TaxID=212818 RepID=A0A438MRU7_EXOME|nr:hypothetical protein B0A52_09979 [Exophiala mesophila]